MLKQSSICASLDGLSKRKKKGILNENVSRTLYYSPGLNRESEVIGRTVFIAPTQEPLIPVKSQEKQEILTGQWNLGSCRIGKC